ncbi:MAG TPA: peptide-methionine (R)-S-oxide reductase [Rhizobiales bacterium]|nr:peptide methionine sulfoxide reductase MsrB [bacterium BMS3Bbin10]HDO51408.1 peptide-methionine (R)-S-oxide reductase [Hyphomicrobiales bacterium]
MSAGNKQPKIKKSDEAWRQQLTPQQYTVTRLHGTEPAFSHPYHSSEKQGTYRCVGCGEPLFRSDAKFDSGTGWPSYHSPVSEDALSEHEDNKLFSRRTEVRCAACESHLGHVFPDGPEPTGLRYCINGVALVMDCENDQNRSEDC